MSTQNSASTRASTSERLRADEVRAEIAYFQQRIREAGEPETDAFLSALVAYGPFLQRRFRLLSALEPHAWR